MRGRRMPLLSGAGSILASLRGFLREGTVVRDDARCGSFMRVVDGPLARKGRRRNLAASTERRASIIKSMNPLS
jgi:hypothetical protein